MTRATWIVVFLCCYTGFCQAEENGTSTDADADGGPSVGRNASRRLRLRREFSALFMLRKMIPRDKTLNCVSWKPKASAVSQATSRLTAT